MILPRDRKIAAALVRLRLWTIGPMFLWDIPQLRACLGTRWMLKRMVKRQTRDGLHHAPKCPGNEWSGANLVLLNCNCGAARMARKSKAPAHDQ